MKVMSGEAKDQSGLLELENERYAAMLLADTSALERLLHRDLLYMHSSGVADTKSSYLEGLQSGIWRYKRIERVDQKIIVQDHAALVFNRLLISILVRDVPKELDNRALAVWVWEREGWQLLGLQSGPSVTG